ncbi:MAG: DUF190 domain-containing protein [Cyanobacteria bacterium REEB65]|nr:DUF190 domain-containing protein [Cyanobacteria bacterium REEB65]
MDYSGDGVLLSIYVAEGDKWHHQPLYGAIVERARKEGLAGATIVRGMMGFGAHAIVHSANILALSTNLPVLIQIVDKRERIEAFLPTVEEMIEEGLVTLSELKVHFYRHR